MSASDPREIDDSALVTRVQRGDERAFDALVMAYYQPLVAFVARYVQSTDAAEDVVQELFIRLWHRREQWTVHGRVRTYLFSAARNAARDAIASGAARGRAETHAGSHAVDDAAWRMPTPDRDVEHAELIALVAQATEALPERCREVYLLARDQGLSFNEIAHVLGITPSTVRTQMGRALAFLERRLAPFLTVALAVSLHRL